MRLVNKMNTILLFLKTYRKKISNITFYKEIIFILFYICISLFAILSVEEIFFLTSVKRKILFTLFLTTSILFLLYPIIKWIISYNGLFNNNNNEKLARDLGYNFPHIKDRLINVYQLYKNSKKSDLIDLAIEKLNTDLKDIEINNIDFNINYNKIKIYSISILLCLIAFISFQNNALIRLSNYNKYFSPKLPFKLKNEKSLFEVLSGDTLKIVVQGSGDLPDSIDFKWIEFDNFNSKKIHKNEFNNYEFSFNNINSNISFWSKVKPNSWISNWDSIGTEQTLITVKERPKMIKSSFKIIFPDYIESEPKLISNSNQINVLSGSTIAIDFNANKELSSAWMVLNNDRINLNVNKTNISGNFKINEDSKMQIYCLDKNYIPNLNPTQFTFINKIDTPPIQNIYLPYSEFEIDESYEIPVNINVSDDYKIKSTYIEYEIIRLNSFSSKVNKGIWELYNFSNDNLRNININKIIDISELDLNMGDEIYFYFISEDYRSNTKSKKFIAKFPTLQDMFAKIETYEENNNEEIDDIQESLEEIFEATTEAKLDLIKDKDLSIEKENNIKKSLDKANEIFEEIKQIQENIEKIQEQAENNNLFDDNLMQKFDHFQKLLQDMMTPELLEAMNKLQESMQDMDPKDLLNALENFEFNMEQFENELDRFIEMFELAQAEKKLEELNQIMDNLIDKQNTLIDQIKNEPDKNKMLTAKSSKQEKRFNEFKDLLDETSKMMEEQSGKTFKEIDDLKNDNLLNQTENQLNNTTNQLSENNVETAQIESEISKENLEEISEKLNEIQENFINESKELLSKEFILIIDNLITVSNKQEKIIDQSKNARSNSPFLRDINTKQNNISIQLNQIMKAMIELSNKTFFLKPSISRSFGKIKSAIANSISEMEQKKITNSKKNQLQALSHINQTIYLLLESLDEMQKSQNASGFDQFMQAMESISNKQQGINQGTMQLNQFGLMKQPGLMEQLQSQQQKLKEELNELMGDNPGQNNGTMEKINNDMDNVLQDFSNKNITQKTIERQQQILNRMLDNQKSLAQKDFSEQRKSKNAEQFNYEGESKLPDNYGEKNILLINAMDAAMQEGHSSEYNEMIRKYFLNLQKNNSNE